MAMLLLESCQYWNYYEPSECQNRDYYNNRATSCRFENEIKGVKITVVGSEDRFHYFNIRLYIENHGEDTIIYNRRKLNIGFNSNIFKPLLGYGDEIKTDSNYKFIVAPSESIMFLCEARNDKDYKEIYDEKPSTFWANLGEVITYGDSEKLLDDTIYFVPQK
jgi:hypothetical protein